MADCPHGMPTPSSCVDCMIDGPVAPIEPNTLPAVAESTATFASRCARKPGHLIEPGDTIRYVDGVGWCCADCSHLTKGHRP